MAEECVFVGANLDNTLDLFLDFIFGSRLVDELVRVMHHLLAVLAFFHVAAALGEQLLVLLLRERHAVRAYELLVGVVLSGHHLLLHLELLLLE